METEEQNETCTVENVFFNSLETGKIQKSNTGFFIPKTVEDIDSSGVDVEECISTSLKPTDTFMISQSSVQNTTDNAVVDAQWQTRDGLAMFKDSDSRNKSTHESKLQKTSRHGINRNILRKDESGRRAYTIDILETQQLMVQEFLSDIACVSGSSSAFPIPDSNSTRQGIQKNKKSSVSKSGDEGFRSTNIMDSSSLSGLLYDAVIASSSPTSKSMSALSNSAMSEGELGKSRIRIGLEVGLGFGGIITTDGTRRVTGSVLHVINSCQEVTSCVSEYNPQDAGAEDHFRDVSSRGPSSVSPISPFSPRILDPASDSAQGSDSDSKGRRRIRTLKTPPSRKKKRQRPNLNKRQREMMFLSLFSDMAHTVLVRAPKHFFHCPFYRLHHLYLIYIISFLFV